MKQLLRQLTRNLSNLFNSSNPVKYGMQTTENSIAGGVSQVKFNAKLFKGSKVTHEDVRNLSWGS